MAKRKDPRTMVVDAKDGDGAGKIILWLLLAAVIIAGLLALTGYLLRDTFFQYEAMQHKPYYAELAKGCEQANETDCCLRSVDVMEQHNYLAMNGTGCADNFENDTMTCAGSYAWCKPEARAANGFLG